ncbi:MAG: PleD family two-component system response regulator [Candidatus Velamenicoccus archaeovorus]
MKKTRVMIVDDEEDFLKIMKINLEETGRFEVAIVQDAADIVCRVRLFCPDIILLDILMPKIGGVEVCRMLNGDPSGKDIPVIVVSALDTEKDRSTMKELGAVDFLVKPLETKDLVSRIEKVLQGR